MLYPCCSTANRFLSLSLSSSLSFRLSSSPGVWIIRLFPFLYGGLAEAKYLALPHHRSPYMASLCFATRLQRTVASLYLHCIAELYTHPEFLVTDIRSWHRYIRFRAREPADCRSTRCEIHPAIVSPEIELTTAFQQMVSTERCDFDYVKRRLRMLIF